MKKHFRKLLMLLSLSGALLSSCSQDGGGDTYIVQDSASKKQSLKTKYGQLVIFTEQDRSLAEKLVKQLEEDVPDIDDITGKKSLNATFEIVPNLAQWVSITDYTANPERFFGFHPTLPKVGILSYNESNYAWKTNTMQLPVTSVDDWIDIAVLTYYMLQSTYSN